jgi:hypothetical protein
MKNIIEQARNIIKNIITRGNNNATIATIEAPEETDGTEVIAPEATEAQEQTTKETSPATYETIQHYKELQGKLFPVKIENTWIVADETEKKLFYVTKNEKKVVSCDCEEFQEHHSYCIHILSALQECQKQKNFLKQISSRDEKINPEALWLLKLAQTRLQQISNMTRSNATCSNYFEGKMAGIKYCLHLLLRQNRF